MLRHLFLISLTKIFFSSHTDDHNRVILRRPAGDTDSDYINASWIEVCFCWDL